MVICRFRHTTLLRIGLHRESVTCYRCVGSLGYGRNMKFAIRFSEHMTNRWICCNSHHALWSVYVLSEQVSWVIMRVAEDKSCRMAKLMAACAVILIGGYILRRAGTHGIKHLV